MEGLSTVMNDSSKKRIAPLTLLLGGVFVFFCAVLVFVFVATKRANPVMLDQQGRPLNSQSQSSGHEAH